MEPLLNDTVGEGSSFTNLQRDETHPEEVCTYYKSLFVSVYVWDFKGFQLLFLFFAETNFLNFKLLVEGMNEFMFI